MYNFKLKAFISEENLLQHISDYDVFRYYLGDFKIGRAFNSPLRTDHQASFNIGYNSVTNRLYCNDYVLGGGSFIVYVMYKYGLSYKEACNKIVLDLNLTDHFSLYDIGRKIPLEQRAFQKSTIDDIKKFKEETKLYAKTREWRQYDFDYWKQYGISLKTLEKYNVQPAEYAMVGEKMFKLDKYAYVFVEYKDGEKTLTIYQPFSNFQKWMKSHDASVWYGWSQLPPSGDFIILTKARKDIMCVDELSGFPVTGLQNEKILPKLHVVEELRKRFPIILVLYDNEYDKPVNWGREFGEKLSSEFGLYQIEVPDALQSKDISDTCKNHGPDVAKETLNNLIKIVYELPF